MNLARHWTSPSSATFRWLLGVLPWIVAVTVVLVVLDHGHRRDEVELLTGGPFATATIVSIDDAAPQARYTNELVGQVVVDLSVSGAHVGDAVDVAYDIDDPYHVERLNRRPRRDLRPLIILGGLLVAAGSLAGAQWSARRQRRLAADESRA